MFELSGLLVGQDGDRLAQRVRVPHRHLPGLERGQRRGQATHEGAGGVDAVVHPLRRLTQRRPEFLCDVFLLQDRSRHTVAGVVGDRGDQAGLFRLAVGDPLLQLQHSGEHPINCHGSNASATL